MSMCSLDNTAKGHKALIRSSRILKRAISEIQGPLTRPISPYLTHGENRLSDRAKCAAVLR
ncbi:hypothetical protein MESS2_1650007 [Mesorhizobium metallidurans STM 2683]|uniref:Transposase n=1 Tax=Mesorhizobium metallidurans STM 2683 TaxID=1297569 RepID=M5ELV6_9HYPH|nr:hypothetical protein MESS2_1650007 [Mesorhizobium metallidurans STM 2683]